MIQVIDSSNHYLYQDELQSFASLRYDVFVTRMGWKMNCPDAGFEQDQFDTEDAIYLIIKNPKGDVVGGTRLLDTSRGSLLGEIFPYLVDGPAPADPGVLEVTRFVVDYRKDRLDGCGKVCAELLWGLQEYGVWAGLTHLVSVSYLTLEPMLRRSGYRSRRMGIICEMDGYSVAALEHDVDHASQRVARQRVSVPAVINIPFMMPAYQDSTPFRARNGVWRAPRDR
jgi:N-acyl-L-homoserine lactone synthetase